MNLNVELNEQGEPLVTSYDVVASRLALVAFAVASFALSLAMGLIYGDSLLRSPLLMVISYVVRYPSVLLAGLVATVIPGVVFGNFGFAKAVFSLHSSGPFAISMTIAAFGFPVLLVVARVVFRACSIAQRSKVFSASLVVFIGSLLCILSRIQTMPRSGPMLFTILTVGFFYVLVLLLMSKQRTPGRQRR